MYNVSMRPVKIMRYGSKYSYDSSQKNNKKIIILVVAVVLVLAAVITAFVIASNKRKAEMDETVRLQMREGEPSLMDVKEGDICMLSMPSALDLRNVSFTSSDPSVVRVDAAGHVDALKEGVAVVTADAPGFAAKCQFTVGPADDSGQLTELTTAIKANEDILEANRANGSRNLYSITVNRRTNTVTVYTYDESGKYTVPVRSMISSCGASGRDITITGNFSIYFQESWHPLYGDVYGMFVSGFEGSYLFHSVPYTTPSHDALETEEFNKLGQNASQGCVRMMASDVYWIWRNCPLGTDVHVIDADSSADPLGRPEGVKLPAGTKWDPTDRKETNPFRGKLPELIGIEDAKITKGADFDPRQGITAKDILGGDITDRIRITGEVLRDKPGDYYLCYTVRDQFGQTVRLDRRVTVTE